MEIIVVTPALTPEQEAEVMAFWSAREPNASRELLGLVVCLLRREDGTLAGFSGVVPAEVGPVGGREFWVYGSVVDPADREASRALFGVTHAALQEGFTPGSEGPLGLCLLLADPVERRLRRSAEWADPRTFYVGYLPDGRQVRIAYFAGAQIMPGGKPIADDAPLRPGHTVTRFAPEEADDVVALWLSEGAIEDEAEARRRVGEVIGTARVDGTLAGVCTAYLDRSDQLGLQMWHYRVFISREHRRSGFAHHLARFILDELQGRWERGEDRRAAGVIYVLQHRGLAGAFTNAVWGTLDMAFVGENANGDHLRVRYFPGADAPRAASSAARSGQHVGPRELGPVGLGDLRPAGAGQQRDVEDLLHEVLEAQERDDGAAAQVDRPHPGEAVGEAGDDQEGGAAS